MQRRSDRAGLRAQAMDPTDSAWLGIDYVLIMRHLDGVTPASLRSALAVLSIDPQVGTWVDRATQSWRPVGVAERDTWLDRVVAEVDEVAWSDLVGARLTSSVLGRFAALNEPQLTDLPFRFVWAGDAVLIRVMHAFADGWAVFAFLGHVFAVARGEADPGAVPWRYASRAQRTAAAVAAAARRPDAAPRAALKRQELRGGDYEPASVHLSGLTAAHVYAASAPDFSARLRGLRDEAFPGASIMGLTTVGLRGTLAHRIGALRPGTEVLYDTRGTDTATAFGNFSVGLYLTPHDDEDPLSVRDAIAEAKRTGLVDLAQLATRVRRGRREGERMVCAPTGAPRLTLSYLPAHGPAGSVPGVTDRTELAILTSPNGLETITVTLLERDGQTRLTASFFAEAWPSDLVQQALDAFVADPATAVGRARVARR